MRLVTLIERRSRSSWWVFLLTALPLLFLGLMGAEHGAIPLYWGLAALCVVQCFLPTLLGWGVVLSLFAAASLVYLYILGADALRLARGQPPTVFLNPYDTTFFVGLLTVLVGLTVALIRNRPGPYVRGAA